MKGKTTSDEGVKDTRLSVSQSQQCRKARCLCTVSIRLFGQGIYGRCEFHKHRSPEGKRGSRQHGAGATGVLVVGNVVT